MTMTTSDFKERVASHARCDVAWKGLALFGLLGGGAALYPLAASGNATLLILGTCLIIAALVGVTILFDHRARHALERLELHCPQCHENLANQSVNIMATSCCGGCGARLLVDEPANA